MEQKVIYTTDYILLVEESVIKPGEWMYDESPEAGLEEVRQNPGPVDYLGCGYFKIISYMIRGENSETLGDLQ